MEEDIVKKINLETRPPKNQNVRLYCISMSEVFTISGRKSLKDGLDKIFSNFNKKNGRTFFGESHESLIERAFSEKISGFTYNVGWIISKKINNVLPNGPKYNLPNFVDFVKVNIKSDLNSVMQINLHFYISETFSKKLNTILYKNYPESGLDIDKWGHSNIQRTVFSDTLKRRDVKNEIFNLKNELEKFVMKNFPGIFTKFKMKNRIKTPYLPTIDFYSLNEIKDEQIEQFQDYFQKYQRFFRVLGISAFSPYTYRFENYLASVGDYETDFEKTQIKILVSEKKFKNSSMYEDTSGAITDAFEFYNKIDILSYLRLAIQLNDEINIHKEKLLGKVQNSIEEIENIYSLISNQSYFSKRFMCEFNNFLELKHWSSNFPYFKSPLYGDKNLFENILNMTKNTLENVSEKENLLKNYIIDKRNFIHTKTNGNHSLIMLKLTYALGGLAVVQLIVMILTNWDIIKSIFTNIA